MELADFVLAHDGDDLGKLALARERYVTEVEDFDLALTTLEVRRKLRDKVPQWYAVPSLRFPLRVSGEQCSSTETARYKAAVAVTVAKGCLADLTGGLGVDSWAF
ncbi:MAG: SAM-dependent methyltransferase, partial [Candidatus Cryptobacteroides sp.]|nr:SAM-dependent methyltransferase [Candidatus Cryptobacteroides sp.]